MFKMLYFFHIFSELNCIVFYCIVFYCFVFVLYCIVMYCIVLYCIVYNDSFINNLSDTDASIYICTYKENVI